jgi:hypothetical protein
MFDVSSAVVIILRITKISKRKYTPLHRSKICNPPAQIKQTLYAQPGVSYAQITKQNPYTPIPLEKLLNTIQPHQQTVICKN